MFLFALLFLSSVAGAQTIYYVNKAIGNDANPGGSWATAFKNVPRAIAAANVSAAAEVDIWITGGDYTPIDGIAVLPTDHNDTSFTFYRGDGIGKALKIYGGFRGNETSLAGRDTLHPTYLDGGYGSGNSYHVVVIAGLSATADSLVLDGLTIENGYAGGTGAKSYNSISIDQYRGGGIVMIANGSQKFSMRNCKITSNSSHGADVGSCSGTTGSPSYGGGIYMFTSHGIITRCTISGNNVYGGYGEAPLSGYCGTPPATGGAAYGAGLYLEYSDIAIINCNFTFNHSKGGNAYSPWGETGGNSYGGGIFALNCNPTITSDFFYSNISDRGVNYYTATNNDIGEGGDISLMGANPTITTCTFDSSGSMNGGSIGAENSNPVISNCTFTLESSTNGGVIYYHNSNGTLSNSTLNGNSSGSNGGAIKVTGYSMPVVSNCTISHNYSGSNGGAIDCDSSSAATFNTCTINYNNAQFGGGVSNEGTCSPMYRNCTFTGNMTPFDYVKYGGGAYNNGCTPVFRSCTFTNDSSGQGGGMYNIGCYVQIDSCTFTSNVAAYTGGFNGGGGAIYQQDNLLKPNHCKFFSNISGFGPNHEGGAIYMTGGSSAILSIYNSVFAYNSAPNGYGGAISVNMGATNQDTLIGNIFMYNKSVYGGALKLDLGQHYVYNNTFYKDTAFTTGGAIAYSGSGGNYKVANNVFYNNYGALPTTDTGMVFGASGTYFYASNLYSATNPLFTNAANPVGADGIWGTYDDGLKLQACSPGVNTGNSAYVVTGETADISGTTRILYASVDIGAYENTLVAPITGPTTVCVGSIIILADTATSGTWSSSNTAIATVSSTGHVTGISQGVVTISYTKSLGCTTGSATYTVTVQRPAAVINGSHSVCMGSTTALTDTTIGGTWTSSNPAVATIGSTGVVTGLTQGSATMTYAVTNACGTSSKTFLITVFRPAAIILGTDTICVGSTVTLTDSTTGGTWSSGTPAVASISTSGVVSGLAFGNTVITYSVSNFCGVSSATLNVTVLAPVAPITGPTNICVGTFATLLDAISDGTWSSSDVTIATVDPSGNIAGLATGLCLITYSVSNMCSTSFDTLLLNVEQPAVPVSGLLYVCQGSTTTMADLTPGGVWSSSAPAVATVDALGVVTGVSIGTSTISYNVSNSCGPSYGTLDITVQEPSQPISGPDGVCVGLVSLFTDTAPDGTWLSSDVSVAYVDAFGNVTGMTTGFATLYYQITNSCGTTSANKVIEVDPLPLPINGAKYTMCVGDSLTFTEAIPGGTWSVDNSTIGSVNNGVVTGLSAGLLTISYTLTNYCGTNSALLTITVFSTEACDSISGIKTQTANSNIRVYPNPAFNTVHINAPFAIKAGLNSADGKVIIKPATANDLDLSGLPSGIYFLTIYDENGLRIKEDKITKLGD